MAIYSKPPSDAYEANFDRVFRGGGVTDTPRTLELADRFIKSISDGWNTKTEQQDIAALVGLFAPIERELQAERRAREEAERYRAIFDEIERAVAKFPTWPTDPLHAVAVLGEEFGELTKATLQLTYEPHKTSYEEVRTEAIQTAAMALRFFLSLDIYQYNRGQQHKQSAIDAAKDKEGK